MRLLLCAFLLAFSATGAIASTCRGEVVAGTTSSTVGACSFYNDTPEGRKILAVCKHGDVCEVNGKVTDETIESVKSVKRTRAKFSD